jgi:hypothetical protein
MELFGKSELWIDSESLVWKFAQMESLGYGREKESSGWYCTH